MTWKASVMCRIPELSSPGSLPSLTPTYRRHGLTSSDIDLYAGGSGYRKLERWLAGQDFRFIRIGDQDHSAYSHSEISEVVTLTNGRRTFNIVVSNTEAAFAPSFNFHSTTVMNFVGGDRIFYGHPRLTLRYPSMVNTGAIYCGTFGVGNVDALQEF